MSNFHDTIKDKDRTIFTVTGIPAKYPVDHPMKGRRGDVRRFGYFHALEDALKAVELNAGDMVECLYDFLVIEEYPPGVFAHCEERGWFKSVHNGGKCQLGGWTWIPCEKPAEYTENYQIVGFSG